MTFTKEQLQHIIETDHVQCGDASALARMALAGIEAEPVAWAHRLINKRNGVVHSWVYGSAEACPSEGDIFNIEVMPLYTAPPAPVSVPDEMEMDDDFDSAFEHGKAVGWNAYRAAMLQGAEPVTTACKLPANTPCKDAPEHIWLQTAGIWPASRTEMGDVLLYRAAPPAPASVPDEDLLHMAASAIEDLLSNKDRYCAWVWADIPAKLRRAAMLQCADRPQNEPQNIPENIPATQFKPVADLYGLTSPTGGETSFTFDAVEARDFIDGGWSCQEYVELGRYQEALTDHSEDKLAMVDHSGDSNNMVEPVATAYKLPDGWVACVERMPSAGEQVLAYRPDAPESNDPLIKMATYVGGSAHGHGFDCYCKPTHWMPLPAAPQQEVNNG